MLFSFPLDNLCFALMGGSLESGWFCGKLSSPVALNIKPLVLRFAPRAGSDERRVKGKEGETDETDVS